MVHGSHNRILYSFTESPLLLQYRMLELSDTKRILRIEIVLVDILKPLILVKPFIPFVPIIENRKQLWTKIHNLGDNTKILMDETPINRVECITESEKETRYWVWWYGNTKMSRVCVGMNGMRIVKYQWQTANLSNKDLSNWQLHECQKEWPAFF